MKTILTKLQDQYNKQQDEYNFFFHEIPAGMYPLSNYRYLIEETNKTIEIYKDLIKTYPTIFKKNTLKKVNKEHNRLKKLHEYHEKTFLKDNYNNTYVTFKEIQQTRDIINHIKKELEYFKNLNLY